MDMNAKLQISPEVYKLGIPEDQLKELVIKALDQITGANPEFRPRAVYSCKYVLEEHPEIVLVVGVTKVKDNFFCIVSTWDELHVTKEEVVAGQGDDERIKLSQTHAPAPLWGAAPSGTILKKHWIN